MKPTVPLALAHLPTPLEPLPRLSSHLGGPAIWVKRDDATGLAFGGNKVRKLNYVLAQARSAGADTIVCGAGLQSNLARQTAAACAKLGLPCELVLGHASTWAEPAHETGGNVLLDHLLGATVHLVPKGGDGAAMQAEVMARLEREGRKPYAIPFAGLPGTLGYFDAAHELRRQCRVNGVTPDWVVMACATGGSLAGLAAGLKAENLPTKVLGVSIVFGGADFAVDVARMATETAQARGTLAPDAPEITTDYIAPGYGLPREDAQAALRLVAELEGLILEPVYTARAMAALIDGIRDNRFAGAQDVVFVHTGGLPALFAYATAF